MRLGKDIKESVNWTGTEYMKYLEKKAQRDRREQKQLFIFLPYMFTALGLVILAVTIGALTYEAPPSEGVFAGWYAAVPLMAGMSWSGMLKMLFLYSAPFVVFALCIGWVVHGVGFLIARR